MPSPAFLHGVVLNIHPETTIVDICHAVSSYDIFDGAWTIAQAYRFFPPRTVHVVVVDPGVGSARRPIIAETGDHIFVAPDNGVLVAGRGARGEVCRPPHHRRSLLPAAGKPDVSRSRHLRAVAGWLSKGVAPAEFGPEITDYVRLPLPAIERIGDNSLRGVVIKVDKFGNLITNIGEQEAPALFSSATPAFELLIAGQTITRLAHSYADGGEGEFFAIVGSSGYLEIAANKPRLRRSCRREWERRWDWSWAVRHKYVGRLTDSWVWFARSVPSRPSTSRSAATLLFRAT